MYIDDEFDFIDDFDFSDTFDITVEKWDKLTETQQEEYIKKNNIKPCYTNDISDTLRRGFGELSECGFWEYDCKKV